MANEAAPKRNRNDFSCQHRQEDGMKYFMTVGTTPLACANSVYWYLRTGKGEIPERVWFIASEDPAGGPSHDSRTHIEAIETLLHEFLERTPRDDWYNICFETDDIIWIPEADLAQGTRLIGDGILKRCKVGDSITIDATAGRKTMATSAVLAGLALYQKELYNVNFHYYWLREFRRESLGKKAYELAVDEIESVLVPAEAIEHELTGIRISEDID
ncbi:MAG: hypothetical protein DRO73_07480 [Candidatus Thorarchaeota archaeon]|nr:MAG: hypothetical protein DRO73_07480 [Candidatus Thorarchaeota archaeon]RLI60545.1 MAG: hypothetical protein DRO93_06760 [Candidatus Thorarchaeota archaeon]